MLTYSEALAMIERDARLMPFESVWLVKRRKGYALLNWQGVPSDNAIHFFNGKVMP